MQLCFFEDAKSKDFHPLTLTRPTDDLRIGILTLSEKWMQVLNLSNIHRVVRPELSDLFKTGSFLPNESYLWINSRYLPSDDLLTQIHNLSVGQCLRHNNTIIAAKVDREVSQQWSQKNAPDFNSLFVLETPGFACISSLWDLFQYNGEEITRDIERLNLEPTGKRAEHAFYVNQEQIYIDSNAVIEPGCILNADNGPIYIGDGATLMSGAHIRGPAAICEDSIIKMGAKIYGDTTIGPVCKIGGEIKNTIFHSYTNKAHEGFIGNSVIGQWCNIGADTNTSNLKNNYSTVRITDWDSREELQTHQQFFGTVMGDHCKTAINTQLNTGTLCGVSCNIFAGDFPPKLIPSFSWVGSNVIQTYRLDKAFEAMEAMMVRRGVKLTESYKNMMCHIFNNAGN